MLDVCSIWLIVIGILFPPRYSGLCCLASGDVTPKWFFNISVYLVPPRASLSSIFCAAKASLITFMVVAYALDRSAYRFAGYIVVWYVPPEFSLHIIEAPVVVVSIVFLLVTAVPSALLKYIGSCVPVNSLVELVITGAEALPTGISTASPFCGAGRQLVSSRDILRLLMVLRLVLMLYCLLFCLCRLRILLLVLRMLTIGRCISLQDILCFATFLLVLYLIRLLLLLLMFLLVFLLLLNFRHSC